MSLLDRIKGMFSRVSLPDATKLLLTDVKDVEALRTGLDQIATENEVAAREIEREIEKLGKKEQGEKERITVGGLAEREKLSALREIQRLRRRMDSLEKRHKIHQDNINLHLGLFDRISEMQAMELKKVNQGQIEEIAVDYEEKLEKHRDILNAARAAQGLDGVLEDSAERKELARLEREILAEAGQLAPPVKVEPKEPKKVEATRVEPAKVAPTKVRAPVVDEDEEPELPEDLAELERELDAERAGVVTPQRRSLDSALAELEKAAEQAGKSTEDEDTDEDEPQLE